MGEADAARREAGSRQRREENLRQREDTQHRREEIWAGNIYYDKDGYADCAVCRRYRWRVRYYRDRKGFSQQLAEALAGGSLPA